MSYYVSESGLRSDDSLLVYLPFDDGTSDDITGNGITGSTWEM